MDQTLFNWAVCLAENFVIDIIDVMPSSSFLAPNSRNIYIQKVRNFNKLIRKWRFLSLLLNLTTNVTVADLSSNMHIVDFLSSIPTGKDLVSMFQAADKSFKIYL